VNKRSRTTLAMARHMKVLLSIIGVSALAGGAHAGELDLDLGLQATTTGWPDDHGGGGMLGLGWWFQPAPSRATRVGVSFIGKEQYVTVDDRVLSYFSVNATVRQPVGPLWLLGSLGAVHQHEEPRAAIMNQPVQSVFGVGDGIRHRMGGRAGVSLALPLGRHFRGDYYLALDVDGTMFMDSDRGPRWMTSAGMSLGITFDFARPK
jgi:hypothetical protein